MQNLINESEALKWFKNAAKTLLTKIPKGMTDVTTMKHPPLGEIVLFKYDPKLKEVLPYYDINPLVLIVKIKGGDFFGINLHYIPPDIRKKLVKKMVKIKKKSKNEKEYIKRVLPLLEALGNSDLFSHSYKHYLPNHVKSKFAAFGVRQWYIVSRLPLQDFKKATAKEVWTDANTLKSKKSRVFGF